MQSNFNRLHNKVFIRSWKIYSSWDLISALIYWFLGIFAAEYVCGGIVRMGAWRVQTW